jgi:hypothetical protein
VNSAKAGFFLLAVLLVLIVVEGAAYIAKYGYPSGSDVSLHLRLSQGWLDLDFPTFNEEYFNKGFPYPPAFHITLASLSLLPFVDLITVANLLQVVLFPLILISTFYLIYRRTDLYTATLSTLILATSPAFWDRGAQVIPQAADLLLFPLVVLLFMEKKDAWFIAGSCYLLYSHWLYAGLPIAALLVYSLIFERERLKVFSAVFLISIPLIILMLSHTPAMLEGEAFIPESGGINEPQELGVRTEPLFAIKYLGYPIFFLLIISAIHLKFKGPGEFEKILLIWAVALSPMLIYFPDRFIEYVAQPLAILGGIVLADLVRTERWRVPLLMGMFLFALASQYNFYDALLTSGEVWMPLDTLSPFVR